MFLLSMSVFFTVFGFFVLFYAYKLNDPFLFILTFFSASLIILISAVMVIAFGLRIAALWRPGKKDKE